MVATITPQLINCDGQLGYGSHMCVSRLTRRIVQKVIVHPQPIASAIGNTKAEAAAENMYRTTEHISKVARSQGRSRTGRHITTVRWSRQLTVVHSDDLGASRLVRINGTGGVSEEPVQTEGAGGATAQYALRVQGSQYQHLCRSVDHYHD
jgi:hypothetical protein